MNKTYSLLIIIFVIIFPVENSLEPKLLSLVGQRLYYGIQHHIEDAASYAAERYPEEETINTDIEKSFSVQYEIDTLSRNGQPNPPNSNTSGLFIQILKPCPNIDYKIRVFTPNLNWDRGISHSTSGQSTIIPGFTQQACNRVYLTSDLVEK